MKKIVSIIFMVSALASVGFAQTWHSFGMAYDYTHESYSDYDISQNIHSIGFTMQNTYWKDNIGIIFDTGLFFPVSFTSSADLSYSDIDIDNVFTFALYIAPMVAYKINTSENSRVYFSIGPRLGLFEELDDLTVYNYYGSYTSRVLFSCLDIGIMSDVGYIQKFSDKWCFSAGVRISSILSRSISVMTSEEENDYSIDDLSYMTIGFSPYISISYSKANWIY